MKIDQRSDEYRLKVKKKKKINQDKRTIRLYWKQLRNKRKEYGRQAEAYSMTGRRNKEAAIGQCVLKLYEELKNIQADLKVHGHSLVDGTLFWGISEQKVKDTNGQKGHHWLVYWMVKSDEPFYTNEEILKELRSTYRKIKAETEEMFGPIEDDEYLEEDEREAILEGGEEDGRPDEQQSEADPDPVPEGRREEDAVDAAAPDDRA